MDKLRIIGGRTLSGDIQISGAKNAALPLMAASLLTDQPVTLRRVPYLADITTMARLLRQHGTQLCMQEPDETERIMTLHAAAIDNLTAPYDIVCTMRASVLVLGPLLARFGQARVSLPGGCAIGTRPVDLHLKALEQMGAGITLDQGYVVASAPQGLRGADITFDKVSVGATENLLMAATLARGTTVLRNAACEPEIGDLARLLRQMGAVISGIDSDTLTIEGAESLGGADHAILPDRIEAGSYLCCVGAAGGEVRLHGARYEDSGALIAVLRQMGIDIECEADIISVRRELATPLRPLSVVTEPHPGFPTDMQAQLMALMTLAHGSSDVTETIFENRYMHVPELMRMGAAIEVSGQHARIDGPVRLRGAEVMATDLRASLSLVIAALAAEGETLINRVYHLDRGYEQLEEKLSRCGAQIERLR